jgi:hypothetical protein
MFKIHSHDPFGFLKNKLWVKKGQESNCQFDLRPLKVKNHPGLIVCKWRATYHWKVLNNDYNFTLDFTSLGGLHKKLWASKVAKVLIFGVSGQNDIWVQALWPNINYIIRWKVVISPKFGLWWILWVYVYSWLVHAPKVLQLCTNQLDVWFVQVCVNI